MTKPQFFRAFYTPEPDYLLVGNDLPSRCKMRQISVNDFCKQQGIKWTDSILIEPQLFFELITRSPSDIFNNENSMCRLQNPPQLALCHMGSEMGLGAFLPLDSEVIKAGTPLHASYGGELKLAGTIQRIDYKLGIGFYREILNDITLGNPRNQDYYDNLSQYAVFADQTRGMMAYFQHAPTLEELNAYKTDDPEFKKAIFTANVMVYTSIINSLPHIVCRAIRDILPGQPIVYSYGEEYFNNGEVDYPFRADQFYVINSDGEPIGIADTKARKIQLLPDIKSEQLLEAQQKTSLLPVPPTEEEKKAQLPSYIVNNLLCHFLQFMDYFEDDPMLIKELAFTQLLSYKMLKEKSLIELAKKFITFLTEELLKKPYMKELLKSKAIFSLYKQTMNWADCLRSSKDKYHFHPNLTLENVADKELLSSLQRKQEINYQTKYKKDILQLLEIALSELKTAPRDGFFAPTDTLETLSSQIQLIEDKTSSEEIYKIVQELIKNKESQYQAIKGKLVQASLGYRTAKTVAALDEDYVAHDMVERRLESSRMP